MSNQHLVAGKQQITDVEAQLWLPQARTTDTWQKADSSGRPTISEDMKIVSQNRLPDVSPSSS